MRRRAFPAGHVIGVVVGVAAAWLVLRVVHPRLPAAGTRETAGAG